MSVTRNVVPEDLADLGAAPPRACLAVCRDGGTQLISVQAWEDDAGYHVIVRREDAADLEGVEGQLVLDDGVAWFELRAVTVRGVLTAAAVSADGPRPGGDAVRFVLAPRRVVAWDYGSLREDDGKPAGVRTSTGRPPDANRHPAQDASTPDEGDRQRVGQHAACFVHRSRVVVLGTTSARNWPFATPLWFVPDRGVLYLTTGAGSWATRNAGHHPEVSLLFGGERGRADQRRLQVRGTAVLQQGLPPIRVLVRLALRYYLSPRCARAELRHLRQWPLRKRYYGQNEGGASYLQVTVTHARFLPAW